MTRSTPDLAIHPPVHLVGYPDGPICSVGAAASFIKRHIEGNFDAGAEQVVRELERADTVAAADAAGSAFRDWAEGEGLLEAAED